MAVSTASLLNGFVTQMLAYSLGMTVLPHRQTRHVFFLGSQRKRAHPGAALLTWRAPRRRVAVLAPWLSVPK